MILPKVGDLVRVTSNRWGCIPNRYYKVLEADIDGCGVIVVRLRSEWSSGASLWHWIDRDFAPMDENDIDFYR